MYEHCLNVLTCMFTLFDSVVSCPKTDRKTRTVVPPLEHFSNSNADDEDDFEAVAGTFFLTVSTAALAHFLFMQYLHNFSGSV